MMQRMTTSKIRNVLHSFTHNHSKSGGKKADSIIMYIHSSTS